MTCTEGAQHQWSGNVKNPHTCHVWRRCSWCGGWQYVKPGRRSTPDWIGHPPGVEQGEYVLVPVEQGVVEQGVEQGVEQDGGAVEQGVEQDGGAVEQGVEQGVEQDGGAVEQGVEQGVTLH